MLSPLFQPTLELAQQAVSRWGSPLFFCDAATVRNRLQAFRRAFPAGTGVYYALKANYNPALLALLRQPGENCSAVDGVDAVSPFEVELALRAGFRSEQVIFTGNNSSLEELRQLSQLGVLCNIGSIGELAALGELAPGTAVSLRFNPGVGAGEFKGTTTGGAGSKFGISPGHVAQAVDLLHRYRLRLVGVHCHIGSGFYNSKAFAAAAAAVLQQCRDSGLKGLKFIDMGGGFGVRYRPADQSLDLADFAAPLVPMLEDFAQYNGARVELRVEPGKFLVAESSVLLVRVTGIKQEQNTLFVGTDSGFNHLIRPAFYGAYHHIVNLSSQRELVECQVVGNICESSDVLNAAIRIAEPRVGDLLAILTCGAYGAAMSSLYNLRPYAAELLYDGGELSLTRRRLNLEQILEGLGFGMLEAK